VLQGRRSEPPRVLRVRFEFLRRRFRRTLGRDGEERAQEGVALFLLLRVFEVGDEHGSGSGSVRRW
jgi:hypothetical protein